jgi:FkbM family methyltransferase
MFDIKKYINESYRGYLELGFCKFPWIENPAHRWMFEVTFLDVCGERLFGIKENNEGSYEVEGTMLCENDIVIDAGANLGLFSALACSIGCTVYAFEPLEKNIRHLKLLQELNPTFKLYINECALSNSNEDIKLYTVSGDIGGSTIIPEVRDYNINHDPRPMLETTIRAITLDHFMNIANIESISYIKADIEGAEVYLVEGAKETIKSFKPKLSLCSYHRPDHPEKLESMIKEYRNDYTIIKGDKKIYAY